MLHRSIVSPAGRHTASLIFLHGALETGVGNQSWIEECFDRVGDKQGLTFKHIKVIYPSAPMQPLTLLKGVSRNVWFDNTELTYHTPEMVASINKMSAKLSDIIQAEMSSGIPTNRIIVGGYSQGGMMALHLGYRSHFNLRGIFGLSSFLTPKSQVYDAIKARQQQDGEVTMPEIFMAHGEKDEIIMYEWGEKTFDKLRSLGVKGHFYPFKYYHEMGTEELDSLRNWVTELLPNNVGNKLGH